MRKKNYAQKELTQNGSGKIYLDSVLDRIGSDLFGTEWIGNVHIHTYLNTIFTEILHPHILHTRS